MTTRWRQGEITQTTDIFVISDLHIGGKYGRSEAERGFRINTHVKDLVNFLGEMRQRAEETGCQTELVINGDLVDFLAEETGEGAWRAFIEDEEEAIDTLGQIVQRDGDFFDALGSLSRSGVMLTLLLGNHDVELSLPAVRSYLRTRLGVPRGGLFQFVYDGEAYVLGDVLIEHGNRYDGWNVVDYDRLRRQRSECSRCLPISPDAEFEAPAGSQLVEQVINPIKKHYAFVDLLKPETDAVIPLILALEPGYGRDIKRIETLRLLRSDAGGRNPNSPARPSQPGNIAGAGGGQSDVLADLLARRMGPRGRDRLLACVNEADRQLKQEEERIAGGKVARALSFLRLVMFTEGSEDRLELLLDGFQQMQSDQLFDWSVETETVYKDAAEELASRQFSTIVFGHTHLAKDVSLAGGSKYLNSGTWADLMRVPSEISPGSREPALGHLKRFGESIRTNRFDEYVEFLPTFAHIRIDENGRTVSAALKNYEAGIVKAL